MRYPIPVWPKSWGTSGGLSYRRRRTQPAAAPRMRASRPRPRIKGCQAHCASTFEHALDDRTRARRRDAGRSDTYGKFTGRSRDCRPRHEISAFGYARIAATRAAGFGQGSSFSVGDPVARAHVETLVIAQVETVASTGQLSSILQVPEIDFIFVGTNDLSFSLGSPGEFQHAKVQDAFDTISTAVTKTDKALGILVSTVAAARQWKARGVTYITVVMEAI